jgi:hypothetical protein
MNIMIIIIFFLTTVKNEMFFEEIKDCTEGLRIHEKLQKQRRNLNISGTSKTSHICFLTCTLIDSSVKERSGFYTQFDLIALEPKKAKQIAKKTRKCQIIK